MTFRTLTVLHFLFYMTAFYIHCSVKPLIIRMILVYVMSIYKENLTTIVQLITTN